MASHHVYLPPGWEEARDPSTGRIYYANRATGETMWQPPPLPRLPPPPPPPPSSLQQQQSTELTNNNTSNTHNNDALDSILASDATTSNSQLLQQHTQVEPPVAIDASTQNNARHKSAEEVSLLTQQRFPINYTTNSKSTLKGEVTEFANNNFFSVRDEGRNLIVCSKQATSYEKRVQSGMVQLSGRTRYTQCSFCPWQIHFSNKNNVVTIDRMNTMHNHPCTASNLIVSEKRSGRAVEAAVRSCTDLLAPILLSKEPMKGKCNLLRRMIRPRIKGIALTGKNIGAIVRGVESEIAKGNYTVPPMIDVDVMQAFTSVDIASENAHQVLTDLINNSDGELSWNVTIGLCNG